MAVHILTYCNASTGKEMTVQYDDVSHSIIGGSTGADCSPGLPANEVIYVQEGVGFQQWRVKVQNVSPFAYVQEINSNCLVVIDDIAITNASTNESSDGSLVVTAHGSLPGLRYSVNGSPWQTSNIFTNLPPGNYNVSVRSQVGTGPPLFQGCTVTELANVLYDDVVCELELGTIEVIKANGGSEGEIRILTVIDPIGLTLQYRINGGTWTANTTYTGLVADDYTVEVRYVAFPSCSASRVVTVYNDVTCDARITGTTVTHESAKYADDCVIVISATSGNEPIEYSIDDGDNYQESPVFSGLSPGEYVLRIRDDEGCEDSITVEVFKFKAPYVEFPIAQSLRIVPQTGPMITSALQNFDNRLFKDMRMPGIEPECYHQLMELADATPVQFRSNYQLTEVALRSLADDSLIATLTPLKKTANLDYTEQRTAYFADAGSNQAQVFFDTEMPTFFEVGMDITISDLPSMNGTYEIKDIKAGTLEAEGYAVLIIDKVWPGGDVLSGTLSVTYNLLPYEVYEFLITWSLYAAGTYYLVFTGTDVQFDDYTARTEPVETRESWPDALKIDWYNFENNFNILYTTGIQHRIRVDGFLNWPEPGGERTVMEDSNRRLRKLREYVSRNPMLGVYEQPAWVLEKLALVFAHDYFAVNDVEYQTEENFEPEYFENDALGNGKCKLRQVEFMAENSNDAGEADVDVTILEVNGQLLSVNP